MPKSEKIKVNVRERVEDNAIDLSLSELTEVPAKDIASFKRVTIVDLSSNKLISLGKHFSLLTNITRLDLSKNQLKYLPDDFGKLRNLRHLDLYNNRLEHLPLSFGNLANLRYLDLKANPLTPALAKIVGQCFTTKDCNDAARHTVKFLERMQAEVEKAKQQIIEETRAKLEQEKAEQAELVEKPQPKKSKKKNKSKKTAKSENSPEVSSKSPNSLKTTKSQNRNVVKGSPKTALRTLFVFFFLLVINVVMIYMITVKNPEIAEKVAEIIPEQYRDFIVSKTELVRLQVSDWIEQFRTPPDQK